jgi:hypothetical protein
MTGSPRLFESSPGVLRTFCGICGTPLTYASTSHRDMIDVTTVSLDRPEDFAPTREIWVEHRLPWEALNAAIPHYAQTSAGAAPIGQE